MTDIPEGCSDQWPAVIAALQTLSGLVPAAEGGAENAAESESSEWESASEEDVDAAPPVDEKNTDVRHSQGLQQVTSLDPESINMVCQMLWEVAVKDWEPEEAAPPPDRKYLLHRSDNKSLTVQLAIAATNKMGQMFPAAAAAASARYSSGRAAEALATAAAAAAKDAATAENRGLTRESVVPALQLLTTLAVVVRASNTRPHPNDFLEVMAYKLCLLAHLESSGLLHLLELICPHLATLLQQHQKQHQQGQAASDSLVCTQLLASACLQALRICIMVDRPAQVFWDHVLARIIQPAVTLATALLSSYSATGGPYDCESDTAADASTSARPGATDFDQWLLTWSDDAAVGHEPIALANTLSHAVCQACAYKGNDPVLTKLLASADMQKLMVFHIGAVAQQLWNTKLGKSPVPSSGSTAGSNSGTEAAGLESQQQPQQQKSLSIPAYHRDLYKACGLPEDLDLTEQFEFWGICEPSIPGINVLTVTLNWNMTSFWGPKYQTLSTAPGLMQVRQQLKDHLQQQQRRQRSSRQPEKPIEFMAKPELRFPLMYVLLETLLLDPDMKLGVVTVKLLSQLAIKGFCFDSDDGVANAFAGAFGIGPPPMGNNRGQKGTAVLLRPAVELLGPVYSHLVETFEPSSDPDIMPEDMQMFAESYGAIVAIAMTSDCFGGSHELCAALNAAPARVLRSLESALRASAAKAEDSGDLLELDSGLVIRSLKQLYGMTVTAVMNPAMPQPSLESADLELFTLLLSIMKGSAVYLYEPHQGVPPVELLLAATDVLQLLMKLKPAGSAGRLAHRWPVMAARALMYCSKAHQVLVSEFSRAGPVMGGMPLPGGFTRTWLEVLQSSTTWLAACWDRLEPEALDQETLDDIKSLHHQLQSEVTRRVPPLSEASPGFMQLLNFQQALADLEKLPSAVLQQLTTLCNKVSGALPLPFCCNNPSCNNLKAVSESSAVKVGRCSGCKVAHYCSAKCQKDHWGQHKTVCKRLKTEPAAAQACKDGA